MARLVSIRFCDKAYPVICDPGEIEPRRNDFCIVQMPDGGEQTGYVQGFEFRCTQQGGDTSELPKIVRMANSTEVREWHFLKRREGEALTVCKGMAEKHKLEMKISAVHFDNRSHKVVFYFTADKRVDFRELVKDLASEFHARIELWQIGVRDETRRLGGVSVCGRDLCCTSWIHEFAPVSIRFAKTQDIQFSPAKLSGSCGRLRCCLGFEQKQYAEMGKGVPSIGSKVTIERFGEVKVIDRNLLTEHFTILDHDGQTHLVPFYEVEGLEERFAKPDEPKEEKANRDAVDTRPTVDLEDQKSSRRRTQDEEDDSDQEESDEGKSEGRGKPRRSRRSRSRKSDAPRNEERQEKKEPEESDDDKKKGSSRRRRGRRRRGGRSKEGAEKQQQAAFGDSKQRPAKSARSENKEARTQTGGDTTVIRPDKQKDGAEEKSGGRRRSRGRRRRPRRSSDNSKPQTPPKGD